MRGLGEIEIRSESKKTEKSLIINPLRNSEGFVLCQNNQKIIRILSSVKNISIFYKGMNGPYRNPCNWSKNPKLKYPE